MVVSEMKKIGLSASILQEIHIRLWFVLYFHVIYRKKENEICFPSNTEPGRSLEFYNNIILANLQKYTIFALNLVLTKFNFKVLYCCWCGERLCGTAAKSEKTMILGTWLFQKSVPPNAKIFSLPQLNNMMKVVSFSVLMLRQAICTEKLSSNSMSGRKILEVELLQTK